MPQPDYWNDSQVKRPIAYKGRNLSTAPIRYRIEIKEAIEVEAEATLIGSPVRAVPVKNERHAATIDSSLSSIFQQTMHYYGMRGECVID